MSFVQPEFLAFLAGFLVLYHALSRVVDQNRLILLGSYVFYGFWDWRFVALLFGVSAANFAAALVIARGGRAAARIALVAALVASLGALAVFKYLDFFVAGAVDLGHWLGLRVHAHTFGVLLPVGISFFTFQSLAYTIDVWRGRTPAERDPVTFLAYVSFFPQLVAGPIERAEHLLAQFRRPRRVDREGVSRSLWILVYGYFVKVVIADGLAPVVDSAFVADQPFGWSVVLGTLAFGLQIYGDFMGYSLVAKGVAGLLGFDLIWNFDFPYWARSLPEFWRRWHVSLSSWLRDYLYIPLGGSRGGARATTRNLFLTMLLGGLWHGASWNFVLWGALHGACLAGWRLASGEGSRMLAPVPGWLLTMTIVLLGWFFFRCEDGAQMAALAGALANLEVAPVHREMLQAVAAAAALLLAFEWAQLHAFDRCFPLRWPWPLRGLLMASMIAVVLALSDRAEVQFIYFRF